MVDFALALSAASNAMNLVNQLRGIQKSFDEAEWKLKVAELNGLLAELKNALVDAKLEISAKDEELKLLGDNFLALKETIEINGYRYDKKEDGAATGHAYCPVCIQKDGYMFHLTTMLATPGVPEQCPNCKAKYHAQVYG